MSPIKGLSDRRRMPRIGKIRTGIKKKGKGKSEYPSAVDYFVVPDDEYGRKIEEVFGEHPRSLRIVFPVEDTNVIAPQWYKCYRSGVGLYCKGDGEHATRVDEDSGELIEVECPCERLENKRCKQMLNLVFMIPEVSLAGVFQIDTSSFNSIVDLNSGIDFVRSVRGKLAMEPCVLSIKPREVSPDGKKKLVYTMHIVPAEGESRANTLLPMGEVPKPVAQLEGPSEQLGTGHVEESDLVPASIQENVDKETGEILDAEVVEPESEEPTVEEILGDTAVDFDKDEMIGESAADALLTLIKRVVATKKKNGVKTSLKKVVTDIAKKYSVKKLPELTIAQRDDIEATMRAWEDEE